MTKYTRQNTGRVPQIQPPICVFYGGPGIGKTHAMAQVPNAFFLMTEKGLGTQLAEHFQNPDGSPVIAETMSDLWAQMQAMKSEEFADVKYVVIDTLTAMEGLIWQKVAEDNDKGHIEDISYGKGYQFALAYHQMVINWAKEMQAMGKGVIFLAHEEIAKYDAPDSQSYDRYQIKLHKAAFKFYHEATDIIGHCHMDTIIRTEDQGFGKEKAKATSRGERRVRLTNTPTAVAKNRFGLPDELPFDWLAIHASMVASVQKFQAAVTSQTATQE